jgi:predicted ester cyclase
MKCNLIIVFAIVLMASACTRKVNVADQNKATMENLINSINQKDWADRVGAFMTPEDFAAFKQVHTRFRTAFPDYHFDSEVIAASGDTVVAVGTVTVTHQAELPEWFFKGIAPDGKQYKWKEIWVMSVKDGKITGSYSLNDNLDILHQLGINCPPETVPPESK